MNAQTKNLTEASGNGDDIEMHLVVVGLVLVILVQEALWLATEDVVHLVFMTLEAAAAGAALRQLLKKLDPNLPALPPLHFVTVSTYTFTSAFIILQYIRHVLGRPDAMYVLWGVLLATLLIMPLIMPLVEAIPPSRDKVKNSTTHTHSAQRV